MIIRYLNELNLIKILWNQYLLNNTYLLKKIIIHSKLL